MESFVFLDVGRRGAMSAPRAPSLNLPLIPLDTGTERNGHRLCTAILSWFELHCYYVRSTKTIRHSS